MYVYSVDVKKLVINNKDTDLKAFAKKQPIIILHIMRRLYMSFHMAELIIMRAQELRKKTGLL